MKGNQGKYIYVLEIKRVLIACTEVKNNHSNQMNIVLHV